MKYLEPTTLCTISFVFFTNLRWEYVPAPGYRLCTFRQDSVERKKQMFECKLQIYKLKVCGSVQFVPKYHDSQNSVLRSIHAYRLHFRQH